jgi:hypothetical protein
MSKTTKVEKAERTELDFPVVPNLNPRKPIQSNEVNVIRTKGKYTGLQVSTRKSFRKLAKKSGMTVDAWMEATGNTNEARGVTPETEEQARVARALGVRHKDLTAVVTQYPIERR